MTGVRVQVVRSREALQALVPAWWELWRRSPAATPFLAPAWLVPWWIHFHPGDLFTLAAYRDGGLVGLAPFYREEGALGRRLLPVGISMSDYHDVLLDPDGMEEVGHAMVRRAVEERDFWDSWELEELPASAVALSLPVPQACEEGLALQSACPVLAIPEGTPGLTGLLPKTKRRKVNMARNRAARRGPVTIGEADAGSVAADLEHLFRLHRLRWESRGESGILRSGPVLGFLRESAPRLQEAGLLRLYTLRFGDEVTAVYCGFVHRKRAYAYAIGFDPAYEFESPGVALVAHAIERAMAEGALEFHFLRGREPYKYEWGASDRWNRHRTLRRVEARDAAA